jgi:Suppressor of fused protein (SUFU)
LDYQRFYRELFAPLEAEIGPIDRHTIIAIIGFDCGGPLNFSTIGSERGERVITYVSCELAVREEQVPSDLGRYELLCSCDNEQWVRSKVTNLGRMSLETKFGHGHTVDMGEVVGPDATIQGVVFEAQYSAIIDGQTYGVFRIIGLTRAEMDYKRSHGFPALVRSLKRGGVYPHTLVARASVV